MLIKAILWSTKQMYLATLSAAYSLGIYIDNSLEVEEMNIANLTQKFAGASLHLESAGSEFMVITFLTRLAMKDVLSTITAAYLHPHMYPVADLVALVPYLAVCCLGLVRSQVQKMRAETNYYIVLENLLAQQTHQLEIPYVNSDEGFTCRVPAMFNLSE